MRVPAQLGLIRRVVRQARDWRTRAPSELAEHGAETVEPLLSVATCARLADLALRLSSNHPVSCELEGDAYLVRRSEGSRPYDRQVVQLMNAQDLDPALAELFRSGRVEELFEKRLGDAPAASVHLHSVTLQVDGEDSATKRGFHVDSLAPEVFKVFVYLTPVERNEDGPYTVVLGSHRHVVRKIANLLAAGVRRRPITDTPLYRDSCAHRFLGPVGTTVLSVQTAAHKGWMPHIGRPRVVLVCYLGPRPVERFVLGRDLVDVRGRR